MHVLEKVTQRPNSVDHFKAAIMAKSFRFTTI